MAGLTREQIRERARVDAARTRLEQGLPAQVGPENPDELARVIAAVRPGLQPPVERQERSA